MRDGTAQGLPETNFQGGIDAGSVTQDALRRQPVAAFGAGGRLHESVQCTACLLEDGPRVFLELDHPVQEQDRFRWRQRGAKGGRRHARLPEVLARLRKLDGLLDRIDVLRRGERLAFKGPTSRDCVQCRPAHLIRGSPRRRLRPGTCPADKWRAATLIATACRQLPVGHRAVPAFGGRVLDCQGVTGLVTRELRKSGQANAGRPGAEGGASRIARSRRRVGIETVRRFRNARTPWLSAT